MASYSYQPMHLTKENRRSTLASLSSDSSDSSISSIILSMGPLSINSQNYFLTNNNQSITKTNQNRNSIENISLCKICQKSKSSNSCETCRQSNGNQLIVRSNSFQLDSTDQKIVRSHSFNTERQFSADKKLQTENGTVVLTQEKIKKKSSIYRIRNSLTLQRESKSSSDSSLISTNSCLYQLLVHPKLSNETDQIETTECLSSPPTPPPPPPAVSVPICFQLSSERFNQFKRRQTELDRSVQKLMENVKIQTNENINQISKYWSYLKQVSLDKYLPKTNNLQLFDYLLKSNYANKQIKLHLEDNDELKAALQILSTTLSIVHDKCSFPTINQLFDNEEKTMIENLRYQLESLLSSYTNELSLIRARIHFYESNFNEEKKFDWIQIIQIDYPCLIENISNDFNIKIPQIEQILIEMLRNMKKCLLNIHTEINKK